VWITGLGAVIALGMASSSLAQPDAVRQGNAPVSGQDDSLSGHSVCGQESDKIDQRNPQFKSDEPSVVPDAPAQPGSLSGNAYADQKSTRCQEVAPVQESFLKKLLKILYGPDTPPGPNPDVDTNISAGGAGGG
jgi:hypothetical protein